MESDGAFIRRITRRVKETGVPTYTRNPQEHLRAKELARKGFLRRKRTPGGTPNGRVYWGVTIKGHVEFWGDAIYVK